MKKFIVLIFLSGILFCELSFSQSSVEVPVGQIWARSFTGNHEHNGDAARAIAVDSQGNAYVCGTMYLLNMGYQNAVVVKYSKDGDSLWSAVQSPPSEFFDIVVDNSGNSYVTGFGTGTGGSGFLTIKYNASGVQQWVKIYNGFGTNNHNAYDIEIDNLGNVYVTGESRGPGSSQDIATVKYNQSGDSVWVKRRTVALGGGVFIGVDSSRNVYVSTTIQINSKTGADFLTIKYNEAGVQQWEQIYGGGKFSEESPSTMCVDGLGNVYVSGGGHTIKYNSLGDSIFFQTLPQCEGLSSSVVDGAGDLIVAGNIFDGQRRFTVAKYSSGGALLWQNNYPGEESNALDLAVDMVGNCYATGIIFPAFQFDALTIKYNPIGDIQFVQRYNGPASGVDGASSIAISGEEVYIAGSCTNTGGTNSDFLTVKYSNHRIIQPGPIGYTVRESNIIEDNISEPEKKNEISKINSVISGSVPTEYELSQNFPNPFNPVTNLEFGISEFPKGQVGFVSLKIYDITGKDVAVLVNEILNPGRYRYSFDASGLPSGIYFYRLIANGFIQTKKMNLIK